MAYHDDLLELALDLIYGKKTTQAYLRRSVSTAYYAIFHLLISETVANWSLLTSRDALGRMFEHSVMKKVSNQISDPNRHPFQGEDPTLVEKLRAVAKTFVEIQNKRHLADYDNAKTWTKSEAFAVVDEVSQAFETWRSIQHEQIAQNYLVSLLIKPRD